MNNTVLTTKPRFKFNSIWYISQSFCSYNGTLKPTLKSETYISQNQNRPTPTNARLWYAVFTRSCLLSKKYLKFEILINNLFHIETYSWDRRHNLAYLQLQKWPTNMFPEVYFDNVPIPKPSTLHYEYWNL